MNKKTLQRYIVSSTSNLIEVNKKTLQRYIVSSTSNLIEVNKKTLQRFYGEEVRERFPERAGLQRSTKLFC